MFPKFIKDKRSWIESVSENLLSIKKRSVEDFLSDFLRPDMPLDEIGILMFSRMMHKHCAVFFNEVWWTTRRDNDLTKCDCYLIYRGKCQYTETIPLTKEEWNSRKLYLKSAVDHYMKTMQNETSSEVNANGAVIGSVNIEQSDQEEEDLLEDVQSTLDVKVQNKTPKKPRKPKTPVAPTRRSKRLQEQDDILTGKILGNLHSTSRLETDLHSTTVELDNVPIGTENEKTCRVQPKMQLIVQQVACKVCIVQKIKSVLLVIHCELQLQF